MIVNHTQSADGHQRVYLGGRGSLECWIEPAENARSWTFHLEAAVTGNAVSEDERRAWAIHTLLALAERLEVSPARLVEVPFEAIAALHDTDPYVGRRIPVPKRRALEHGYMATTPQIRRPASDFAAPGPGHARPRR